MYHVFQMYNLLKFFHSFRFNVGNFTLRSSMIFSFLALIIFHFRGILLKFTTQATFLGAVC